MKAASVLALALAAQTVSAMELLPENFDEATAGKTVFIKYQAPWCGHCKSMKPAWDQLMAEFADSKDVLVGDVDCTAGGKDLCGDVRGFPTIKYGDPADLQDYKGGRDFDSLKKFAGESLGPSCSPAHIDLCEPDKKAQIDAFMALAPEDLAAKVTEKETEQKTADSELEALLKSLQNQYEEGQKANEAAKAAIKESGLGLMKAVQAHKKKTAKAEL